MKKILILSVLLAVSTSSCEDFLNTKPTDKIAAKQYYTDEEGITHGLYGVYDVLASNNLYGTGLFKHLEVCTDEGYFMGSSEKQGPKVYVFDGTDGNISGAWADLYKTIERANDVIAHINLPKMEDTNRQIILGEALFLRGYCYFMLVSRWGDVPLRLTPTTSPSNIQMARTPSAEVYAQILKDMKEAEGKVREKKWDHSSRISKTVVQGILARVCLQMAGYPLMDTSKYAEALAYSQKVIDSGERGLNVSYSTDPEFAGTNESVPSIPANSNNAYRQIFINMAQEIYDTRESMWEIEYKGNGTDGFSEAGGLGCQNGILFGPAAGNIRNKYGFCYGYVKGTGRLFNIYGVGDLRRDWVLNTFTYSANNTTGVVTKNPISKTQPYGRDCAKWRREYEKITPKNQNTSTINYPVLRFADVLLMNAEAENQVNGPTAVAYNAINQVRRRGYGLPIDTPGVADLTPGLSKAAFQQAIEDERMRELCFEGTRRLDLIRWNKFVATMNSVGNEIATNTQNTGQQYGGFGGKNVVERHLLYPIPSIEMFTNPLMVQNKGW